MMQRRADQPSSTSDQQAEQELQQALEDPATRDLMINLLYRKIDETPANHPDRVSYLSNLGKFLFVRFSRTGDQEDLNRTVQIAGEAVKVTSNGHPEQPTMLGNLLVVLLTRFKRTGDTADLNRTIQIGWQFVEATSEDHPNRAIYLSSLGDALRIRWGRTRDLADLNQAIRIGELTVQATPDGHPDRAETLTDLTVDLLFRFQLAGGLDDLNHAVQAAEDSVQAGRDDAHRRGLLNNHAKALSHRFDWVGDLDDLNQAVEILRQLLRTAPDNDLNRAAFQHNLGYALIRRFERLGDLDDMNHAIQASEDAVHAALDKEKSVYQHNLGNALMERFSRLEDLDDLNRAIQFFRQTAGEVPDGHFNQGLLLSDLGNALRMRFERTSNRFERGTDEVDDLDESIQILRQAVQTTTPDNPNQARYLHNLSLALYARFIMADDLDDLNQAVQTSGEALRVSLDHQNRQLHLSQLGATLFSRFERTGDLTDLDQAIQIRQQTVQATPSDHPYRADMLCNVGAALFKRFERTRDLAEIDQIIQVLRQAVQATRYGEPNWAEMRDKLGAALTNRFKLVGDPDDADTAIELFRTAALEQSARLSTRIEAAFHWSRFAASLGRWSVALDGYSAAVGMLSLVAWQGARRIDRERFIAKWAGLASEAAGCAIAAGQARQALDLLEQGRGILWSQLLETRTDLSMLHESAPELASRLVEVRAALDTPAESAGTAVENIADARARSDRVIDRQMALAYEWDALVAQVRSLASFEDFPRPRGVENLSAVVAEGPVIVVNISQWRCDALAVTAEGTRIIPLPALTVHGAVEQTNHYLMALHRYEERHLEQTARTEFELAISTTLEWLWDTIADPVLTALGYTRTPSVDESWSRLWWCPTGPLTLLPLHAAGHHNSQPDHSIGGGGLSVMDRVVSSYVPTLRALIQARATRPPLDHPTNGLLLVAMPTSPGQAPLPNVERERELLTRLFPPGESTVVQGLDANRRTVRDALNHYQWVHFSCHGGQDLREPSRGGVLLEDGILTVSEIGADRHDHGEFAFLSACKTAVGGVDTLDEAITLVAALQHAGWRHVIGTMWSVWDTAAADITTSVYPYLLANGTFDPHDSALALHHAVRELRDGAPTQPSLWAPFMHAGP